MAKVDLNTIKNWFKTGLKPNQAQFWDTWDSFWHKDDDIPTANIADLDSILNQKAEKTQVTALAQTIAGLQAGSTIIPFGSYTLYKADGNTGEDILPEVGDTIQGLWSGTAYTDDGTYGMDILPGAFILAKYNGGDVNDITSYIIKQIN